MENEVLAKVVQRAKEELNDPTRNVSLIIDGKVDDVKITMIAQDGDFAVIRNLGEKYYIRIDKIVGMKSSPK